jgi:hypothetical protein
VSEVAKFERTLATIDRLQKPVGFASGLALAIPYVLWQYLLNHWIATYTWLIPFAVGGCASYFGFAMWGARVDRARRQLLYPDAPDACRELPSARVVASGAAPQAAAVVRAPVPPRSPDLPPVDPADGPRFLT